MALSSPVKDKPDRLARADLRSSPARSSRQDQDAVSESSSVQSGEAPERRDIDILAQVLSTRSEEYRLLFRLPHDEVLVQDYNCALQDNILLQGHMYLFIHHICFYSNIFGFETKRIIAYYEVTSVRKAKTAAIFHNAIEITTFDRKHFFGSFLSRDEAYKLIVEAWQQHSSETGAFLDGQESKSESNTPENSAAILERESDCIQQADFSDYTVINGSGVHGNESENLNGCVKSEGWSWQPEEADAPKVPDYYTMVAEGNFPVKVEDFFKLFFSDDAADFLEKFHQTCGDKDFKCSRWHRNAEFVHARDLSFRHPIKIYFGAKFGHCHALQKFRIYRNSHLLIEVSQQFSDVPYGDYFYVQVLWDVENDASREIGSVLRVYINVAFSRKTMWKGKIEQSTIDECRDVYGNWIVYAHELLKERNLEDREGGCKSATNIGFSHDMQSETSSKPDHPVQTLVPQPCAALPMTPHGTLMEMPSLPESSPLTESSKFANPAVTIFKGCWANLSAYASSHHGFTLLIVLFLAMLLLIQTSIIILLVRNPQVHVISQDFHMSGRSHDKSEAFDWLEKRVYLLSEEMSMMETRMERMAREYAMLKGHLQDIQRFKHK